MLFSHRWRPHQRPTPTRLAAMAMIGRNAAIAEVGPRRRELHGFVAYTSWLGVHAWLLSGFRARAGALGSWTWDYVASKRAAAYINRPDAAHIDWDS